MLKVSAAAESLSCLEFSNYLSCKCCCIHSLLRSVHRFSVIRPQKSVDMMAEPHEV